MIDEILRNEEIQFRLAIEAVNIESEEQSQALLREIVNLWTTIRGFSIAAVWMETYKEATRDNTKIYWTQKAFVLTCKNYFVCIDKHYNNYYSFNFLLFLLGNGVLSIAAVSSVSRYRFPRQFPLTMKLTLVILKLLHWSNTVAD